MDNNTIVTVNDLATGREWKYRGPKALDHAVNRMDKLEMQIRKEAKEKGLTVIDGHVLGRYK